MASFSAGHGPLKLATTTSDADSSSSSSPFPATSTVTTAAAARIATGPPPSAAPSLHSRDHVVHLDASQTTETTPKASANRSFSDSRSTVIAAQRFELPRPESESRLSSPSPSFLSLRSLTAPNHHPYRHRNALSSDTIPHQTIMKAIASRPSWSSSDSNMPPAASLGPFPSNTYPSPPIEKEEQLSSQSLAAALTRLQPEHELLDRSLVLQSPCFFHQRFDDAVNIKKVLEEIADDEWLSHSRLVQTATGVREVSKQLQRRPIKRAVKNVMIVTKARDNSLVRLTREVTAWLLSTPRYGSDLGVNVYVDAKLRNSKRFDAAGLLRSDPRFAYMLHYWTPDLCWSAPEKFDLVITLGGDGTVLFTSWLFQRIVPPILSFSLGSLGFLTNFDFDDYKSHLNAVMGDVGMRVNLRMRFTCTVFRKDRSKGAEAGAVEEGEQFEVLNELVIDRGPSPYVSNLELYADNELLTVVQADGCIFSTPTGMFT